MDTLRRLKEVGLSIMPIFILSTILGFSFSVFSISSYLLFLLSTILVIVGLTFFLFGIDISFMKIGNMIGSQITKKRSVPLLLFFGFLFGLLITIAEPDVGVLSKEVCSAFQGIDEKLLILFIALGVGLFMAISYFRVIHNLSIKITFAIFIIVIFLLSIFSSETFLSISFDSGGATTGPLSVPFIMALGLGIVSSHGGKKEDSFGFTGITSFGPVLMLLVFGLFFGNVGDITKEGSVENLSAIGLFLKTLLDVGKSIIPLVLVCIFFQIFSLKLPKIEITRIIFGILWVYIGIVLFLFGANYSFSSVARRLGGKVFSYSPFLFVIVSFLLGFSVCIAEPAVWVLSENVEINSTGLVRKRVLILFISLGVAFALALSSLRLIYSIPFIVIIFPLYALVLILLPFSPKLFVSIAFDSGGVATGPLATTFLLPFLLGASSSSSSFGMIGLIAAFPILMIEILGLVFLKKQRKIKE